MRDTLAGDQFKSSQRTVITVIVITIVTTTIFIIITIDATVVFREQFTFLRAPLNVAKVLLNKRRPTFSAFIYCVSLLLFNFALNLNQC